jgi:hypothetical protein
MNTNKKFAISLGSILLASCILVIALRNTLALEVNLVIIVNLILALITALTFWLMIRNQQNSNPRALITQVMGGTVFRLFACILLFVIVILIFKNSISKSNYFFMLFMYLVYTIFDSLFMTRIIKK